MNCPNFKTLADLAAVIAALVSIGALIYQIRRARLSTSLDLVTTFEDKFNREDFRKLRLSASKALLNHPNAVEAEEVFDFFETLGYLAKTGAADKEFLWHTFYH